MTILTDEGYVIDTLYLVDGSYSKSALLYSSDNCTGIAYAPYYGNGVVFESAGALWYVDKLATATDFTSNSESDPITGVCTSVWAINPNSFPALVNDQAITGVIKLDGQQPFVIAIN